MLEWELNEIYNSKTKGIEIRSKAKWIENGIKPKYFLGLERQHLYHNVIKELKSNEENVIEGTNAILGEMITYYKKLYTMQNISSAKNRWLLIRNQYPKT